MLFNQRLIEELRQGLIILDKGDKLMKPNVIIQQIVLEALDADILGLFRYYTKSITTGRYVGFNDLVRMNKPYFDKTIVPVSAFLEPELEIDEC